MAKKSRPAPPARFYRLQVRLRSDPNRKQEDAGTVFGTWPHARRWVDLHVTLWRIRHPEVPPEDLVVLAVELDDQKNPTGTFHYY